MDHVMRVSLPAAATWSHLTSEPFLRMFSEEVGVELHSIALQEQQGQALATMDWSFLVDRPGMPEVARRMLPASVRMRWSQSWGPLSGDRAAGQLDVALLGRPSASSRGQCTLESDDLGSTLRTSTSTKTDLPFPVASRVESLIDRDLVGWVLSVQARVLAQQVP